MDPRDVHVQNRIEELRRGAAQRRLAQDAIADAMPVASGDVTSSFSQRVHALSVALGRGFVRIGVALGAPPLGDHRPAASMGHRGRR